ncbi:MAG: hypothetical protein Q8L48_34000 [Archangium sp.]|nr:hypothetical protein [Archangium sp.]
MLDHEGLLRLLRRISDGLAKAIKMSSGGKNDEALAELRQLCVAELGMEFNVLSMLDAKAVVDLLFSHQRVLAFVQIVEAMGDVEQGRDRGRALAFHQRAFLVAAVLHERDGAKQPLVEISARLLERIS